MINLIKVLGAAIIFSLVAGMLLIPRNEAKEGLMIAFIFALAVALAVGPLVIPVLRKLRFGQSVRPDGPARHLQKTGTPTMGGVIFLAGLLAAVLTVARDMPDALAVLGMAAGYGLIGFLDDYIKVVLKRSLGLRAREKLFGQVLLACGLAYVSIFFLDRGTDLVIPFSGFFNTGGISLHLAGWSFAVFTVVVMVGTANAVNLTDGLDGLAAGVSTLVALALMLIGLAAERTGVALSMAALAGGCLGFLYYNRYPARIFMGDTGSLALGGALAAAAVITGSELFLIVIGGIYALETLSVIIQVISFQTTGRRVFRMSPLHHHFELGGWGEAKVVVVFWLVTLLLASAGLLGTYGLYNTGFVGHSLNF